MKRMTLKEFFKTKICPESDHSSPAYSLIEGRGIIFKHLGKVSKDYLTNLYPNLYSLLYSHTFSQSLDYNYVYLDRLFYLLYGDRTISGIFEEFMTSLDGENELDWADDNIGREIALLLITRFGERWEEYINELNISYNPIHNYDMNEEEHVNTDMTVESDNTHSIQGFNSTTFKPENQDDGEVNTTGDAEDNYRTLERSGNIGVTTSQQMLISEIELRDNNIVIKRLLEDVASILLLGVY